MIVIFVMVMAKEKAINNFTNDIFQWQVAISNIGGMSTNEAKNFTNDWLNEFELTFRRDSVITNAAGGYDGFKESRNFSNMAATQKVFSDTYKTNIEADSIQDLNKARQLRNILALSMKDNFDTFKDSMDNLIEEGVEQGWTLQTKTTKLLSNSVFQDTVFLMDSIGRKWQPNHYATMYARTRSRDVEQSVMFDDLVTLDQDIVRITTTDTNTPICLQHIGRYFSLSGKTKGLPILELQPPFHPNCVHHMIPVEQSEREAQTINNKIGEYDTSDLTKSQKKTLNKQTNYLLENRPNPFTSVKTA